MKQKGFTLIELLVTLALIGLIAAVAIPMYQGLQNEDEKLRADGCSIIESTRGERVLHTENVYKYPVFEAFRCTEGDLIRSRIRYVDKKE